MRETVEEFKGLSIEEIVPCIEGTPEVGTVPTYPGMEAIHGDANMVCLANEDTADRHSEFLKMLETLFSARMSEADKLGTLANEFGIDTKNIEAEVRAMCNLSDLIEEKGIEKGRTEGRTEGRAEGRAEGAINVTLKFLKAGKITVQEAADELQLTTDEVEQLLFTKE